MKNYLETGKAAAKEAGKYLLENRGKITPHEIDEKAKNDFVTEIDHGSEKMIIEMILNDFPEHKILAEESSPQAKTADYLWIIDPLDGTRNYIQDVPAFSVSIALRHQGKIIVGVIYDPVHDELFSAIRGEGAHRNGKRIRVTNNHFSRALIATGFPFRSKRHLPAYLLSFEEIFLKCSGIRRCGSAAIDLAYLALGRFDGFWEIGLSIWDIAAGSLIIEEAGGIVTDFWGGANYMESGYIVAGNPNVYPELAQVVKRHFPNK
jgi:myo-inositol-1(or 4)-monophosphatase